MIYALKAYLPSKYSILLFAAITSLLLTCGREPTTEITDQGHENPDPSSDSLPSQANGLFAGEAWTVASAYLVNLPHQEKEIHLSSDLTYAPCASVHEPKTSQGASNVLAIPLLSAQPGRLSFPKITTNGVQKDLLFLRNPALRASKVAGSGHINLNLIDEEKIYGSVFAFHSPNYRIAGRFIAIICK